MTLPRQRQQVTEPNPDRAWDQPHPSRLDPATPRYDEIMAAHDEAVQADTPGYRDPRSGLFVLTARYLDERRRCCDRGCRHCPYI